MLGCTRPSPSSSRLSTGHQIMVCISCQVQPGRIVSRHVSWRIAPTHGEDISATSIVPLTHVFSGICKVSSAVSKHAPFAEFAYRYITWNSYGPGRHPRTRISTAYSRLKHCPAASQNATSEDREIAGPHSSALHSIWPEEGACVRTVADA